MSSSCKWAVSVGRSDGFPGPQKGAFSCKIRSFGKCNGQGNPGSVKRWVLDCWISGLMGWAARAIILIVILILKLVSRNNRRIARHGVSGIVINDYLS
jgi:hypothetical protein